MKNFNLHLSGLLLLTILLLPSCKTDSDKKTISKPSTKEVGKKTTIADVERGIRENIAAQTANNNGIFYFKNDTAEFNLKLVRVHTEYLSILNPGEYFACVDLATKDGDVYDVDFFLDGKADNMHVTKTTLHKLNGKPYYSWKQRKDKTWYTVPVKQSSNKLLGVIEGKDQFIFTYQVDLPKISSPAKIWLPIAQSDSFQTVELLTLNAPTPDTHVLLKDKKFNNEIFYMELTPEHSEKNITIKYKVLRKEKSPYPDPNLDLDKYLSANILLPVNNKFSSLAQEIITKKKAKNSLEQARALYDYVTDNIRYAKQGKYGTGDANYACDAKTGNCTEFHSLFISLARSAGIPARFAVGAAIPSNRDDGGIDGYHCWAEFYADNKWWPVDISEANKYSALATYYFGHHPANRIEFTHGRDIIPEPTPNSGPINFLAYPVYEVEGQPITVPTKFSFVRITEDDE